MPSEDEFDISPEELLAHLKRLQPYLPSDVTGRRPGAYPDLDAAAPVAERLGELILQRSELGLGRWETLVAPAMPVAEKLVLPDMDLFAALAKLRVAERVQTRGSLPSSAMDVFELFGPNVAWDVANEAWQFGYAGCLARLFLKAELSGTDFPLPCNDTALVQAWAQIVRCLPFDQWVDVGTAPPFTGKLVLEVLWFLMDQLFLRLFPLFGAENELEARGRLRGFAVWGYAMGRAVFEQTELEAARTAGVLGADL
jgi:hypothetical protein